MIKVSSPKPISKVSGGALGSAVSTVLLWLLHTYLHISPPPEVAAAFTGLVSFGISYVIPIKEEEIEIE